MTNVLYGFSNSMFQSSKLKDCGESNWTMAIKNKRVTDSTVEISHWDNITDDVLKMKETFNVTSYRISIEWSHIEPIQGLFNLDVMEKYKDIAKFCNSLNIKPMFTLHHFNEPLWFSEMGGFEKEENIQYFVNFCKYVFTELHNDVKLWCTINEPCVYGFMGYFLGSFPPYQRNINSTINVLKNLLISHVQVYKELKNINPDVSIGIVHNVLIFKKLYQYDPIAIYITNLFNPITNDLLITFFKTGKFSYQSYFCTIDYENSDAINSNDFIGLNFYANPVVGPNIQNGYGATYFNGQIMGDMYLAVDHVGFSNAIDLVATFNKPIYITETGIADKSDKLRERLVEEYGNVISDKIKNGTNICGIYFWTFRDNYEWNQEDKLFGFHDVNGNPKNSCESLGEFFNSISCIQSNINETQ